MVAGNLTRAVSGSGDFCVVSVSLTPKFPFSEGKMVRLAGLEPASFPSQDCRLWVFRCLSLPIKLHQFTYEIKGYFASLRSNGQETLCKTRASLLNVQKLCKMGSWARNCAKGVQKSRPQSPIRCSWAKGARGLRSPRIWFGWRWPDVICLFPRIHDLDLRWQSLPKNIAAGGRRQKVPGFQVVAGNRAAGGPAKDARETKGRPDTSCIALVAGMGSETVRHRRGQGCGRPYRTHLRRRPNTSPTFGHCPG